MRPGKRRPFLMSVLLFLFVYSMPVIVQADVEVKVLSTLDLDKSPIDVFTTADGKWAYILTPGEILVYSLTTRTLLGRIPVDKDIRKISLSSRGDQLYLMNDKTKTLSIVSVGFVNMFTVTDSPFKGPAKAPVVITVFSDYQ